MINTTTMLAHIKGSVRDFLFPFQAENRTEMVQYGGEISWEVSSTITKDSLLLRFIPLVRFFTPYRMMVVLQTLRAFEEQEFSQLVADLRKVTNYGS